MTSSPASCGAVSATVPPAASITAAASRGGATERITSCVVSAATRRDNDRNPSVAKTAAAHTHTTQAMSMEPQYEAAPAALQCPAVSAVGPAANRLSVQAKPGASARRGLAGQLRVDWNPAGPPGIR